MGTQAATVNPPGLYGITHSNRRGAHLWGKNEFNSTFPTALACYMRDQAIRAVYISLQEDLSVSTSEITIDELFNSNLPNNLLQFDFESRFDPYQQFALDEIGGIDLVVKHHDDTTEQAWRRPLEVKLTVTSLFCEGGTDIPGSAQGFERTSQEQYSCS
jgi:hypothetical protein